MLRAACQRPLLPRSRRVWNVSMNAGFFSVCLVLLEMRDEKRAYYFQVISIQYQWHDFGSLVHTLLVVYEE